MVGWGLGSFAPGSDGDSDSDSDRFQVANREAANMTFYCSFSKADRGQEGGLLVGGGI